MRGNPLLAAFILLVPGAICVQRKRWFRSAMFLLVYGVIGLLYFHDDYRDIFWGVMIMIFLFSSHLLGIAARLAFGRLR